jgi:hypothetical protein
MRTDHSNLNPGRFKLQDAQEQYSNASGPLLAFMPVDSRRNHYINIMEMRARFALTQTISCSDAQLDGPLPFVWRRMDSCERWAYWFLQYSAKATRFLRYHAGYEYKDIGGEATNYSPIRKGNETSGDSGTSISQMGCLTRGDQSGMAITILY